MACADCLHSPSPPGVSKTVTVDVKGGGPLWLKLKDLADGVTYTFRIRAKTFMYGPELEANITTGPGEGEEDPPSHPLSLNVHKVRRCGHLGTSFVVTLPDVVTALAPGLYAPEMFHLRQLSEWPADRSNDGETATIMALDDEVCVARPHTSYTTIHIIANAYFKKTIQ